MVNLVGNNDVLTRLSEIGIVPVIRTNSQDLAYKAIMTLAEIGFRTVEVTMTVPGAAELIGELSRSTDLILGAGTILAPADATASIRAGAHYVVSPCMVEGLPAVCHEAGVACVLGGLTPTEVITAWKMGSDAVKIFPAASVGGPDHLKALKSVFPFVPLVPTGGVNLTNVAGFLRAGAAFVGAGSDLVNVKALLDNDTESIALLGRKYLQAVADAKMEG
ncbi:MAG TPA: bifunctional 4-hydroxy-2-oxoglutarate aldolase/2-dehydro-3-deoxy-phosphogluconate aldolase [Symbiobacteriaceae bacterium]|nr:bifunctional 4-hydroxy-2-oxoglutarate aldolase/2-dehydro-3-deoxy-phosphogluconate aldolase [Symbiobacteriaceae bacterium]